MADIPVRDSIRQIDDDSWLVGGKLPLSRAVPSESAWGYTIAPAPDPLPASHPLPDNSADIKLVYDVGDCSAVFSIGSDAFCKVHLLRFAQAAREHVTLAWLHKRTWSFPIPTTLYHAEFDGRYYHFISRVPGQTMDSVWGELDDAQRQRFVKRIVEICDELAVSIPVPAPGDVICGVDGGAVQEEYLSGRGLNRSPENLKKNCLALGMDCSRLVFYHRDLGPTNVLVDLQTESMSAIDWESAGYMPKEWVLTKFRVSSGMDLSGGYGTDWRRRVMLYMRELGYTGVAEAFIERNKIEGFS